MTFSSSLEWSLQQIVVEGGVNGRRDLTFILPQRHADCAEACAKESVVKNLRSR